MSYDWAHQFCLACDKQTDGAAYCSESCRLADYEKTASTSSSGSTSPALHSPSYSWSMAKSSGPTSSKFYLSPAYDFTNAQPYGSTPSTHTFLAPAGESTLSPTTSLLSTSSSHSSLVSIKSQNSARTESSQLSERARRELRAYASSFESVRLQRRRSY